MGAQASPGLGVVGVVGAGRPRRVLAGFIQRPAQSSRPLAGQVPRGAVII